MAKSPERCGMCGDKVGCLFEVTDDKSAQYTFDYIAHTRLRRLTVQNCVVLAQIDVGVGRNIIPPSIPHIIIPF